MRVSSWGVMGLVIAAAGCGSASSNYGSGSGGGGSPPACAASSATATTSVSLSGTSFVPSCIKVTAGSTLTFTNMDTGTIHTVTTDAAQPMTFDSGNLAPGQHFSETFPSAGTVEIHCNYHAAMGMRATIIVQ